MMAGALMVAIALIARRRAFPRAPATPVGEIPRLVWRALPPLLLPCLLLVTSIPDLALVLPHAAGNATR